MKTPLIVLAAVVLLAACAPLPTPAPDLVATSTSVPTGTPTPVPTSTLTSTPTPTPTSTPTPTATPTPDLYGSTYRYIHSLIDPRTGLVAGRDGETSTTLTSNALAAMAFIHQGDRTPAERIFDVFGRYQQANQAAAYEGMPRNWDPTAGRPFQNPPAWTGDSSYLLLALNYYGQATGESRYPALQQTLVDSLSRKAVYCDGIMAENVAEMYAALAPYADDRAVRQSLDRLQECFYAHAAVSSVRYAEQTSHVVRAALVFCDVQGFSALPGFSRSETWSVDPIRQIVAYSARASQGYINVEASAELLLAAALWPEEVTIGAGAATEAGSAIDDPSGSGPGPLRRQLARLMLPGVLDPTSLGLPYNVARALDFPQSDSTPSLDPTAYWLFAEWQFNPFAPGKRCTQEDS